MARPGSRRSSTPPRRHGPAGCERSHPASAGNGNQFAVLGGSAITNTGPTQITGDVAG